MTGGVGGALFAATLLCVLANAAEVAAKAVRARFMLRNAAEVGVDHAWIPYLALLEGAGTAGLVLGLLGLPLVGLAAAAGLVLFFVGAVAAHVRARVFHNIAFPAAFLGLAVAALAYFAGRIG
ncbi:DoxX family protein [Streptomonospora nanhaiensis]|uniref:CHASE2 domain-containing sensor protein n=1 Tax=Streptomonospora nanhaiensis TaxID=1323731 RepID=A0A853BV95_9ACTN|nr:DoxX family protein [Streptomonospora nanhaiensis]NYI98706.1 CHASE2 domain-containing sensor protein [Streptomonospora nanhaiensis]